MHSATANINHVAGENVKPVEQFFRALFANCLFQLNDGYAGSQSQSHLCTRLCVRHIPALSFSPGLFYATGLFIIGMNLYGKLLMRKQKLQQQGKPLSITSSVTNKFPL